MYIYVKKKKKRGGVYIFLVIDRNSDICAFALRLASMIDVNMYTDFVVWCVFIKESLRKGFTYIYHTMSTFPMLV